MLRPVHENCSPYRSVVGPPERHDDCASGTRTQSRRAAQMCQCRCRRRAVQQVLTLVVVRVVPHQGRLSWKDGVTPGDELRSRAIGGGHENQSTSVGCQQPCHRLPAFNTFHLLPPYPALRQREAGGHVVALRVTEAPLLDVLRARICSGAVPLKPRYGKRRAAAW